MGEQMRSHIAACKAVQLDAGVFDIFRYAQRVDPAHHALIDERERDAAPAASGSSTSTATRWTAVLEAFAARGNDFDAGYNIIVPAWELPAYPKEWAEQLRRFDEVWALSALHPRQPRDGGDREHTGSASRSRCRSGPFLPRRYFGIRESAFVLLHFFDLSSYSSRKNPTAVLDLLDRMRAADPSSTCNSC